MRLPPTRLRWAAAALGLFAFAARQVSTFWVQPRTFQSSFPAGYFLTMGTALAGLVIAYAVFAFLAWGKRPAKFVHRDGALIAQPSAVYAGSQAICSGFLSGGLVMTERVPEADGMRLAQVPGAWPMTILGVGFFWSVAVCFLLVQRPELRLDPEGLTITRLRRITRVPWDQLAPGGPLPPARRNQRNLRIYLDEPPLLGAYAPSEDIPVAWLHIDAAYLAGTIRYYVEHPEDRASIGAPAADLSPPVAAV